MINILSSNEANLTDEQFERLYQIALIAYRDTEEEIWGKNYVRIYPEEYRKLYNANQLFIAFDNREIVGAIYHCERSEDTYCFGLLVVDFAVNGKGIGRKLVERVEEEASRLGYRKIQIEILRPNDIPVPMKVRIADWYQRMGYVWVRTADFADYDAEKAKRMVNPSEFDVYEKELGN